MLRRACRAWRPLLMALLTMLLGAGWAGPALAAPHRQQPVALEIHYYAAGAGEVFLVWGINGWLQAPEALRPPGTVVQDAVLRTPMARAGEAFVATLHAPPGTTVDYAFEITRTSADAAISVWDANGTPKRDYHTQLGAGDSRAEIHAPADILTRDPAIIVVSGRQRMIGLLVLLFGIGLVFGLHASITRVGGAWQATWARIGPFAQIALFVLATRLALFGLGYVAIATATYPNENLIGFDSAYQQQVLQAFGRADVTFYIDIAQNGYERRPFSLEGQANWAFYPLWPLVLRLAGLLFSNLVTAGIVISTLAFVAAELLLYQLLRLDFDEQVAQLAVIALACFPAAHFFARPGPEALFLLLTVGALLAARKQRWLLAGALGGLATLTRLQGLLLLAPLLAIYAAQYRRTQAHQPGGLALAALPLALAGFMGYLYTLTGNPFASFDIQKAWENNASYPFDAMAQFIASPHIISYYGFDLNPLSFGFVFSAVLLTIAMLFDRRVPIEYTLYTVLNILLTVARDTLTGSLRYLAILFPLFALLALLIQHRRVAGYLVLFALIASQVFYVVFFVQQLNWAAN